MDIIEVKNNLVKLNYEEDLGLSNLVLIKDKPKSYIAQIVHLESTRVGKIAIAKLIFRYDGQIKAYDGSVPSVKSETTLLPPEFSADLVMGENPLLLGKLAGYDNNLVVDFDILNDNPIILSEKFYITKYLLNNLALQIRARNKKLVVFDTAGVFKTNRLTLTKDFKLPLNLELMNYIYETSFSDATAESKAMIQSIFDALEDYAKTVEFIPFDTFRSVIDSEFVRTRLMQLVIMKNKLKQFSSLNLFAQSEDEFKGLKSKLTNENLVIIDLSKVNSSIQSEAIKYIYSLLKNTEKEVYAFTTLVGDDETLLSKINDAENVHTMSICSYGYRYLNTLKKVSKNMIMFTPQVQQKDFGSYNIFLQRLAEDEFIAYGKMSKFIPIIGKLYQMNNNDIVVPPSETVDTVEKSEETPAEVEVPVETVEPEPTGLPQEPEPEIEQELEQQEVSEDFEIEPSVDGQQVPEQEPETDSTVKVEEITQPEIEDIKTPEVKVEPTQEEETQQEGNITIEPPVKEITYEEVETEPDELQEALEQVPEIEDDDELSDDDLDMIERLSTPDNEIEVLRQEPKTDNPIPEPSEQEPQIPQEPEAPAEEPTTVEQEPENTPEPPSAKYVEPLQTRSNSSPSMPEYSADIPSEDKVNSDVIQQGDKVFHEEFGEGVVEKMINYGDKLLCSINFASVGRRLLNPEISELKRLA